MEDQKTEIIYPKATSDGFCFLDETDEALGIESNTNERREQIKRLKISDGRTVVVKELKAWEAEQTRRLHKDKEDNVILAFATMASLFDNTKVTYEEMRQFGNRDWTRIKTAVTQLNFL